MNTARAAFAERLTGLRERARLDGDRVERPRLPTSARADRQDFACRDPTEGRLASVDRLGVRLDRRLVHRGREGDGDRCGEAVICRNRGPKRRLRQRHDGRWRSRGRERRDRWHRRRHPRGQRRGRVRRPPEASSNRERSDRSRRQGICVRGRTRIAGLRESGRSCSCWGRTAGANDGSLGETDQARG